MSQTRHLFVKSEWSYPPVTTPEGAIAMARQKTIGTKIAVPPARPPKLTLAPAPLWHRAAEWTLRVLAFSAVVAIVLILVFIAKEAAPIFYSAAVRAEVTMSKMWVPRLWPGYDESASIWQPVSEIPKFGIWPLVLGTVKVTVVAMAVSVPLGVGGAVYLSQYARPRTREIVKPVVELLAGIPSVVLGFFALMVMATWFQRLFGLESRLNALVSGVALSFAVIPLIFTFAEEALRAVPRSYVEASTALGAARWQTISRVVLPAASPGIAAGVALGLGRAVGETMIVLMASGNAAIISASLADSTRTISATIAAELAEVVFGGAHYTVLFFLGTLLFLTTFCINTIGDWAIRRMKIRLGGTA
ncbi:MAG TPA: phosphate ABC transporter permease subunit PstC [Polyangia bacterium]|nr:phosphate ABC transporter permease subunit PstC [Polyangia bacterium]